MNFIERYDALNEVNGDAALARAMIRNLASRYTSVFDNCYDEIKRANQVKNEEATPTWAIGIRDYALQGGPALIDLQGLIPKPLYKRYGETFVTNKQYNAIIGCLGSGRYVDAIKELRSHTGWGLKESKDVVDYWRECMNRNAPFAGSPPKILAP